MNTMETEQQLGIQFCQRQPLAICRGQGVWVWDEQDRQYLDMTAGWGVTSLGHCHPVVTAAIQRQSSLLIQNPNSGFTYSPARARLLRVLGAVLPDKLTRMYFVNSGAEANDAAIKLARKIRGRSKVVSTVRGFHGRTQATWNATGGESQVGQFPSSRANTEFVPYGNINAMTAAIDGNTAAVIIEPIQGEGGIRIPPAGYLAQVRELCSQAGACLIIDEIQTGFCRTGSLFALQQESVAVAPDFMTMGKGIGGGFPFAGFAVSEAIASQIQAGDHGGTYAGNPLGCAVAAEVVKFLIEQDVSANVRHAGDLLCDRLLGLQRRFPQIIQEVRGRGLMLALQLPDDAVVGRLCSFCLDEELIVTPTRGAVIRLLPSLLITTEEIDHAVSRLALALGRLASTAHVSCDRLPRSMPA